MDWFYKKFDELSRQELYEILRLRINVFVVEQNCPYDECDGKDYAVIHIFAKDGNDILAYARIIPPEVSVEEVSIGRVVVNPKYRGSGLAKRVMKKAIDYIFINYPETPIKIEAQEYLKEFYINLGFKVVSKPFLLDNISHIEMLYKI